MFFVGLVVGGICFTLPLIPQVSQPIPAEINFSFVGILYATSNVIPYSLMGDIAHEQNSGTLLPYKYFPLTIISKPTK